MYLTRDRLVIFDADGTLIDSFPVVERAFMLHGMDIGDLQRFQRRRKLLKYIGGLREFPKNLRQQLDKENRKRFKRTLTEVYRGEVQLFPGMVSLLKQLIATPDVRVGIVSRNVTIEPEETLSIVLSRFGIDSQDLDFLRCIPHGDGKAPEFRAIRERFGVNPLLAYACGDEYRDYADAGASGMQAIVASYGFEDHGRLVGDYNVPLEVMARTPSELAHRLRHGLNLPAPGEGNSFSSEI